MKKPNRYPRQHQFRLTVTFNKGVLRRDAAREVSDTLVGVERLVSMRDGAPAIFTIKSIGLTREDSK